MKNTIAAMYAEIGKLNEARQIALQSLTNFGYDAPSAAWWYVFGRISERLGAKASATLYYEKAGPDSNDADPLSVHSLARKRLDLLHSGSPTGS